MSWCRCPIPACHRRSALRSQSGLPFELGIIRNHYVGRTFIEPEQHIRKLGREAQAQRQQRGDPGQAHRLIDDSIVRGTTSIKIVQMMYEKGAREVHLRVACPPITYPDFYGIDTPEKTKLLATPSTLEEMRRLHRRESLAFLSVDGIYRRSATRARCRQPAIRRSLFHRRLPDPARRSGR